LLSFFLNYNLNICHTLIYIKIHKFLKCKGVTRTDLRFDEKKSLGKKLFVLEINTQPGMTPLSLVPMMAKYKGLSFNELIKEIINEI